MKISFRGLVLITMILLLATACSPANDQKPSESKQTGENLASGENAATVGAETKDEEPAKNLDPLSGTKVEKSVPLAAIMVGNNPEARPQSGLAQASLVYEVEAEGMVTRYLALFHGDPPETVGPVRSARPYFLMLAKEWDAYFVHVGGSNEAYAKIPQWQIKNLDDMKGVKGFFTDNTRKRPDKTYFHMEKGLEGKEDSKKVDRWEFDAEIASAAEGKSIKIQYGRGYVVNWRWDSENRVYRRYLGDKPYLDRDGSQLTAKNIIVQYAKHRASGDKYQHIEIDLIGQGDAEYFLGGSHYQGKWQKDSLETPTEYQLESGEEVKLVPGKTWIQVQRSGKSVTFE